MEARGLYLPVVEARLRYRQPARYDEEITIEVRPVELRSRSVRFGYRVLRGDDLLVDGETTHVLTGDDGKPRAFPPEILARFAGEDGSSIK
jgi:acyl-CoA thioester hydrolase